MITLTPKAQQVIANSKRIAQENNHRFISTEHLLIAITGLKIGQALESLSRAGIAVTKLRKDLFTSLETVSTVITSSDVTFSPKAQRAINEAAVYASKFEQTYIGTEHILLGILDSENNNIYKAVASQNVTINDIRLSILDVLKSDSSKVARIIKDHLDDDAAPPKTGRKPKSRKTKTDDDEEKSMLNLFTRDLTMLASENKLLPTIGREHEIDRCIEVLMRYSKNNPIFIGEAGVGKTAIVEGVAQKIITGNVPDQLLTKRIYQLDITMLVAGTKYRGDLEERIKLLMEEVQESEDNIIFIDEIHMIVGAGSSDSSMDIGNIIKPALSRGELTCIGATTTSEYRQNIETDSALQRRFQQIQVEEPSKPETLDILKGIKNKFEKHHNVKYTQTSLKNIIELSDRYISERNFPDKAIDVMDEIGSHIRAKIFNEIFETDVDIQLNKLEKAKLKYISKKEYDLANDIKKQQEDLLVQYDDLYSSWLKKQAKPSRIKEEDVLDYMSNLTGMPITRLQLHESSRLRNLKPFLDRRIIGQGNATSVISAAIKRARVGINDPNRPLCSFLFLGPTGVGKTHSAKIMSDYLFNNQSIIQINMSECGESHSISKLIGAPPGYVGYSETGLLTEGVRRNPYSLILLDEIEKAHPDVIQVLLQLLEEGTITDSTGISINFRHAIIIMTGNIGSSFLEKPSTVGFMSSEYEDANTREKIDSELTSFFRPELINRIDEIVVFDKLDAGHLVSISRQHIKQLGQRLKKKHIILTVDDNIYDYIVSHIDDDKFGARPIRRAMSQYIEDKICDKLISSKCNIDETQYVHVAIVNNKPRITLNITNQKTRSLSTHLSSR
jgi:ATP-dependent Clp protease ATP-binding subunit ClpC